MITELIEGSIMEHINATNAIEVVSRKEFLDTVQRLHRSRQKNKNYRRAIKDLQKSYEHIRLERNTAVHRSETYRNHVNSVERANQILVKRIKELENEQLKALREDINRPWWRVW